MSHAIQSKLELFNKYEFIKSYISIANPKTKQETKVKEEQAALIASAIKDNQDVLLKNLATKDDILSTKDDILLAKSELKNEIQNLKYELMIKGGVFLVALITFAPKLWNFLEVGAF